MGFLSLLLGVYNVALQMVVWRSTTTRNPAIWIGSLPIKIPDLSRWTKEFRDLPILV